MDWYLCFDASTPRCVIAVGTIEESGAHRLHVADDEDDGPNQASVRLMPRIAAALQSAGIEPPQLKAIACGRGPGTFTGTRVAIASAKGLALGLRIGLVGVSTLTAVAMSVETGGLVLPLLDARRGEVYGGLYDCQPQATPPTATARSPEQCTALNTLVGTLDAQQRDTMIATGPGVSPYRDDLGPAAARAIERVGPTPAGLWLACVAAITTRGPQDPGTVQAVYLRKSYAELGINKPKSTYPKSPFV